MNSLPTTISPPSQAELDALGVQIEAACRSIMPTDLGTAPLYVGWDSDLSGAQGGTVWGLTSGVLDLVMEESLGTRWRDRGAAMVLAVEPLQATAKQCAKHLNRSVAESFREVAVVIALHEISHVADIGVPGIRRSASRLSPPDLRRCQAETLSLLSDRSSAVESHADHRRAHGLRWLRAACHVFYRAMAAGLWPAGYGIQHLVASGGEGLSPAMFYWLALGNEPRKRRRDSFANILNSLAPTAFTELLSRDLAHLGAKKLTLATEAA